MNVTFEGNTATGKNEWLTPPSILQRLGTFDLDPCAPVNRPWDIAAHHYTVEDDGLRLPWHGRVFCNPPYDKALIAQFIQRCAEHRNAVALTFVRTDTQNTRPCHGSTGRSRGRSVLLDCLRPTKYGKA